MAPVDPIILSDLGIVSALGLGKQHTWQNLFGQPEATMSVDNDSIPGLSVAVGKVRQILPPLNDCAQIYHTRCHQLLLAAYHQIEASVQQGIKQYGAQRVAVVIGTSTSGTDEAEQAFTEQQQDGVLPSTYHYEKQEMGAVARFTAQLAGSQGVAYAISTACSSGAKALIAGANLIRSGLADAVICGGVDSLCRLTLNGFHALESLSPEICNPFSQNRSGINIGEGAALFLMQRGQSGVSLLGHGESSDAYHMSAPHPNGDGALAAMTAALKMAAIEVTDLDYINLHGTATEKNDQMEAAAVVRLGGADIACSSTKPFTGHTLAAAGAIEAGICWLAMSDYNRENRLPKQSYDGLYDPEIEKIRLATGEKQAQINYCLSNSFAFGGSNVSLLLARQYE